MKPNAWRILIYLLLLLSNNLLAQDKLSLQKLSPNISSRINEKVSSAKTNYTITLQGTHLPKEINTGTFNPLLLGCYNELCFYSITASLGDLQKIILPLPQFIFAEDRYRVAKEESLVSSLDLSINSINLIHNRFPLLNGNGLNVSVKENKPDTTDIDLKGRYLMNPLASAIVNAHATIMSTMIAGAGNTWHLGKGAAWAAGISSSNFINL